MSAYKEWDTYLKKLQDEQAFDTLKMMVEEGFFTTTELTDHMIEQKLNGNIDGETLLRFLNLVGLVNKACPVKIPTGAN